MDMASCENEPEEIDSTFMKNREDISPLKTSNGDINDEHDIQETKTEQPNGEQECIEKYEMVQDSGCHLDRKDAALVSMSEKDSGIDPESPRDVHEIDRFMSLSVADDSATSSKHTTNSESGKTLDNTRNTSCVRVSSDGSGKVSLDPRFMHGKGVSRLYFEEIPSRKSSMESFSMYPYSRPTSRKSSLDAFYCVPHTHHKISVMSNTSNGSHFDFTEDTCETLPHADHYKEVVSIFPDFKQRPTLNELREDETVSMNKTTDLR